MAAHNNICYYNIVLLPSLKALLECSYIFFFLKYFKKTNLENQLNNGAI